MCAIGQHTYLERYLQPELSEYQIIILPLSYSHRWSATISEFPRWPLMLSHSTHSLRDGIDANSEHTTSIFLAALPGPASLLHASAHCNDCTDLTACFCSLH